MEVEKWEQCHLWQWRKGASSLAPVAGKIPIADSFLVALFVVSSHWLSKLKCKEGDGVVATPLSRLVTLLLSDSMTVFAHTPPSSHRKSLLEKRRLLAVVYLFSVTLDVVVFAATITVSVILFDVALSVPLLETDRSFN